MAKYKISDKAILTDSDGTRDLIAESLTHTGTFTATNTNETLSPDYFTNYFPRPYTFQGETSGYTSGGGPNVNTIDKFSFSSDGNATDVGDLTQARANTGGSSSSADNGYTLGGNNTNIIDKFPFSSDANATDVGDLTISTRDGGGAQG